MVEQTVGGSGECLRTGVLCIATERLHSSARLHPDLAIPCICNT